PPSATALPYTTLFRSKAVAESAMREVAGKTDLQASLTRGRGQVQVQAAELMQATLDYWNSGVTVVEVQIRSANPPTDVVPAFRRSEEHTSELQSREKL